ncbi:MAG: bifunctional diguanylate cyclase/phosphodiesterase [Burkholderiaceae bacterium]|nr:bifunctional diguanylate cyclase/phosphodiesterase [Burkholderiaceae bacterium]
MPASSPTTFGPLTWALLIAVAALVAGVAWALRGRLRSAPSPRRADHGTIDPVTGLMSRAAFEVALAQALDTERGEGRSGGLLYVGLDGFRLVNEGHGHAQGDKVLVATAGTLRQVCGERVPMCRCAGDEFAIWLNADTSACELLARRVAEALAGGVELDGQRFTAGASIGLALFPRHGTSAQLVLRAATAMRAVKRAGGGTHALFDPRIETEQREELKIAQDLRLAVSRKELELVYQPKIEAASLQVTAVEALLRWKHPQLGMVSPTRFIPIAEKHGLIEAIGNWVLEAALTQAAVWRKAGLRMRVAINVSGFQMRQDDFAKRLQSGLRAHGLQPNRFTCEITESVAMEDTQVTRSAFDRLRELGVHVSIDDFGTGHSSLATLRRLPAQEIKIDRAFVADMATDADAKAIVAAVLTMARALGLRVVAEGVETPAQRDLLVQMGCDELQGYLFAKPMSARAIALWAMDAPTSLAQTFSPSLFKDTAITDARSTEIMPSRPASLPR